MTFKRFSELNKSALYELKPDFGYQSWSDISENDRHKIWKYLEFFFFDKNPKHSWSDPHKNESGYYHEFFGETDFEKDSKRNRIVYAVDGLNQLFKAKSHAINFLENRDWYNACSDFNRIFLKESEAVVMELISLYAEKTIKENKLYLSKYENEKELEYNKRLEKWNWKPFDEFAKKLNEVFSHFDISVTLTRLGLFPKQEERINNELIEPVLRSLSHPKWEEVNQHLNDAFLEYRKRTPLGFSTSVTKAVTAVQAFLQILVYEKTGKGDISKLIPQAISKGDIPSDLFTKEVFKTIESILMRERQEAGVSHPSDEYSTEKNAKMVLNLAMLFFQHCLPNK